MASIDIIGKNGKNVGTPGTLVQIDEIPEDTDFTIWVQASQFSWRFVYPDENGAAFQGGALGDWCRGPTAARCDFTTLRLQEDSKVRLMVTSTDVIHAFAVPEFGVKMDAVPGKVHEGWIQTPSVDAPTEFFVQCMEYCGVGHHLMGPSKEAMDGGQVPKLVVFPEGSQPRAWGRADAAPPASGNTTAS